MAEENDPLIIDIGTGTIKAGVASDDAPRYNIPTVVGIPDKKKGLLVGMDQKDAYIGIEAIDKAKLLDMFNPVQGGVIVDMDKIELIIQHIQTDQMSIDLGEYSVMITEPPLNAKAIREKTMELMFEKFQVQRFYLGCAPVMSLFATGRTTGTVVDSGQGATHVVPIFEGYAIPHAITPIPINGQMLTDYMHSMIKLKDPDGRIDAVTAEFLKCTIGEVAVDPDAKLKEYRENPSNEMYTLPGGARVPFNFKEEKIMCPELLFTPKDESVKGIQYATNDSIMKCDQDIKKELFRNIVLAGGSTMFRGMQKRMKKEIQALAPSPMAPEVETPADRKHSAWLGGAILSKIDRFKDMWITKKEYDEKKQAVVHEKCF